jgi:hypothetical protein
MLISYSRRETKNLGNYENISVGIKVEDEVNVDTETPENALNRLKKFVSDNLDMELGKADSKISTTNDLRQQISQLIATNDRNKIIIKSMLAKYGVNKIGELNETETINFTKELETLKRKSENG